MSDRATTPRRPTPPGRVRASLAALTCLVRGLPLLLRPAPGTPLRVLALVALDTVHVLRTKRLLSRRRLGELALVVDFQACANAAWDHKDPCPDAYRARRQRLHELGLGPLVEEYLERLAVLEGGRPSAGRDRRTFEEARAYREEVAGLSLATLAAIALETDSVDAAIHECRRDGDLDALLRMALLCQVVDDVVDHAADRAANLPTFLTSSPTLCEALERTSAAARAYGAGSRGALPLRAAVALIAGVTRLVLGRAEREARATRPILAERRDAGDLRWN